MRWTLSAIPSGPYRAVDRSDVRNGSKPVRLRMSICCPVYPPIATDARTSSIGSFVPTTDIDGHKPTTASSRPSARKPSQSGIRFPQGRVERRASGTGFARATSQEPPDSRAGVIALLSVEPHVLVGGPDRQRHQVDRMIGYPGPHPNQHPRAPDRREHHAVDRQLLDAVEQGFTLRGVPLAGLLLEQFVDVGVSAIGVAALGINERLHASGGVA